MRRWLLLHSPLLGPTSWGAVGRILAREGPVVIPTLRATAPPWAASQAAAATAGVRGEWTVVAHSGAGALVPSVGALLDHVEGCVFVDAVLPHPGLTRIDTLPAPVVEHLRTLETEGMLPPWPDWWPPSVVEALLPDRVIRDAVVADCRSLPMAMFTEVMPAAEDWPDAPCAYLRLSAAYDAELAHAEERGWATASLDLDHLALVTRPREVAAALRSIVP